jgi:hypothetical protein
VYHVEVGRVVVSGASTGRLDARELQTLVEHAVARELANAALPEGPTMRAAVQVTERSLATGGASAVAGAVAAGVARAAGGGSRRG